MNTKDIKNAVKGEESKVKVRDLVNSLEALKILIEQKVPIIIGFKISLFIKSVSLIVEAYENERNKLIKDLGTPVKDKDDKETGNFNFTEENGKEFNEKINGLLDTEADIKVPNIKIKDLDGINIEPKHLVALTWLINE